MKKRLFIVLILLAAAVPLLCQQEQEVKVREEVSVVNVEVPVRVFYQGKPAADLIKEDFQLYEDGKLQRIHGFYRVKKKIKRQELETAAQTKTPQSILPSRYFVLVFRTFDYNDDLKKGLDYLFKHILKQSDRLLVFANEKTLFFDNMRKKTVIHESIDRALEEQCHKARLLLDRHLLEIKRLLLEMRTEAGLMGGRQSASERQYIQLLEKYLVLWKQYKRRFLVPDIDSYYNFAQYLERIGLEKWVISFYQVEMFPRFKYFGEFRRNMDHLVDQMIGGGNSEQVVYARKIMALLAELDRELGAADDFPAQEISRLFYKVGATFHSILMTVQKEIDHQDLELAGVSTDIENSLREITAKTGGKLMTTNNLDRALETVVELEDISYVLTYAPDNPARVGRIKVTVAAPGCRVIYDKNMRADYIQEYIAKREAESPSVRLEDVTFKDKKLSLLVGNFMMKAGQQKKTSGMLRLRIQVKDSRGKTVYDKTKSIEANKKSIRLTLGFAWLQRGEYNIIVDVDDLLTGKSTSRFLQPTIE